MYLHQAERSSSAREKSWPGPSLLASFSPPNDEDVACATLELSNLALRCLGTKRIAHVTLHPITNELDTFVLVLYCSCSVDGDGNEDRDRGRERESDKDRDGNGDGGGGDIDHPCAFTASCVTTIELRPDGLFLRASQRIQLQNSRLPTWSNCSVVQEDKLWTVDTYSRLHVWEFDGSSAFCVAHVDLIALLPSLQLDSNSVMSASDDASVIAITTGSGSSVFAVDLDQYFLIHPSNCEWFSLTASRGNRRFQRRTKEGWYDVVRRISYTAEAENT